VSLPAGQQRTLQRIEQALVDDDTGMEPLFAVFARLTARVAMPPAEQVTSRRRLRRPVAITVIAPAALLGLLILAILTGSGPACRAAPAGPAQAATPRTAGCRPGTSLPPTPPHAP
jgi:hypothetical protein